MINRRRELETKVEQFGVQGRGSKLAELLPPWVRNTGWSTKRGLVLGLKITHQEMANLIGSTRENRFVGPCRTSSATGSSRPKVAR